MRWLFVGILVLNAGFLGWHLLAARSAPAPQVAGSVEFPARVLLLEERGTAPVSAVVSEVPVGLAAPALSGCPALGPMVPEAAQAQLARLAGAGFPARVVAPEEAPARVFWVHIPPVADRNAALLTLRQLHARGVDSFVVADGADANAISLGSFQNRESALGVQARLAAAGYQVKIREQSRAGALAWVVLDDPRAQGFSERLELPAGATIKRMSCAGSR